MKIKIGVFFGGKSVEHEVSIITALQAIENIDKEKYDIIPIYISKDNKFFVGDLVGNIDAYKSLDDVIDKSIQVTLAKIKEKVVLLRCNKKIFENKIYSGIDIAFPIVHGTNVEDGTLQGYLKMFDLPYVGSDVLSSAVGMDKYVCKCLLKENGIPVIEAKCFSNKDYFDNKDDILNDIAKNFDFPVIVKPINLGSSVGISISRDIEKLEESIENAFTYSNKILIEKAVENIKEVNCSVLGDYEECIPSECEEPIKCDDILSFNDKYISGNKKLGSKSGVKLSNTSMNQGHLKLPADISSKQKEIIQDLAVKTFKVLGSSGVIRIDFIIDTSEDKIYVNEVNTIPGSLSFHLWRETNLSYTELLNKLIDLALKRHRNERNLTFSFDSNILSNVSLHGLKGSKGIKV